ncbi:MAG: hypothetical protein JOZ75_12195, partial [Candidatus Dormibacteraeota bacterium]|nr:hypothetical protein [Candidatus Dormibacteraeota bacterium]
LRPQHAYGILRAADEAKRLGIRRVTLIEFGVASGAGLMNMAYIAQRVTRETGVHFDLHGFDTGEGMPPPDDYRDHPEYYQAGDFQMDEHALRAALPGSVNLVLGDLSETVPQFLSGLTEVAPIGFVTVDVDYYWSTCAALRALTGDPCLYLPLTNVYFDDVLLDNHNSWQGQLLAIREFNDANAMRKLEHHQFLENQRVFRNASWLKQLYALHVMDHPARSTLTTRRGVQRHLENAYLGTSRRREQF